MSPDIRIITGGQTGADRGAMQAALDRGIPCGGWCPEGRKAEDGSIPLIYPVRELPGGDYAERTVRNALEADASCIVRFDTTDPGSKLATAACRREEKPYLYLEAHETEAETAAMELLEFVKANSVHVLNVSGPRASLHPAAAAWTRAVVRIFLMALQDRRMVN